MLPTPYAGIQRQRWGVMWPAASPHTILTPKRVESTDGSASHPHQIIGRGHIAEGASPKSANSDVSRALCLESRIYAVLWQTIPPEGGTPNFRRLARSPLHFSGMRPIAEAPDFLYLSRCVFGI